MAVDEDDAYHCPRCGSTDCARDEVGIGVGIQHGPWRCTECGYEQGDDIKLEFPELFQE